ncbi:MAG: GNAT family N-acetyltransferase [Actinomycetales bacterium]
MSGLDGAVAGWPLVLRSGPVVLRPLRLRDRRAWRELRETNVDWLRPWESTAPGGGQPLGFGQLVRGNNRLARMGQAFNLAIEVDGRLAGQVSLSCIVWGSLRSGAIGYWIDSGRAGRGIVPVSVALLTDHAVAAMAIHRIEINIRPENAASLRVVQKLGFRDEGVRLRYLHIDGAWRDHRTFALTAEELPAGGLITRVGLR